MQRYSGHSMRSLYPSDHLILSVLGLFVFAEILAGPIRYYLSENNLTALAYVPKGLVVLAVILSAMNSLRTGCMNRTFLIALVLFCISAFVGYIYTKNIPQVAFGAWSLSPLLFGILALPVIGRLGSRILPWALVLWITVILGVFLNAANGELPWTGTNYQIGDVTIEASRSWGTYGFSRMAGFARASFSAAYQALFLGLLGTIYLRHARWRTLVRAVTGTALLLTTTKTAIAVWVLLVFLSISYLPWWPQVLARLQQRVTIVIIAIAGVGLPFISLIISYNFWLIDPLEKALLGSFTERLYDMWPIAISLAIEHGSLLVGRGLGGIGAAQQYYEPGLYSPGDNLYVYLFVVFGLAMLPLVALYVWGAAKLKSSNIELARFIAISAPAILVIGWTINVVEDPIMGVLLGASYRFVYDRRHVANNDSKLQAALPI